MGIKIWWPLLFVATIILACILIFPSDLRLADLLGRAGKFEEAIETYQKILQKDPYRNEIRVALGNLYILNNQPEKAISELEKLTENYHFDLPLLDRIYGIYSKLGEKQKTIATLEKIARIAPENIYYQAKLAEAYEWNNDTDKAIELYEALLSKEPNAIEYLNKLINLYLNKKDYEQATTHLEKLLELEPHNLEKKILLGNVYIEANKKELAALEFEQVLRLEPANEPVRVKLAELYLWMQNFNRSLPHYEYLVMHHILNEQYFNKLIDLTKAIDPSRAIQYFEFRLNYLPHDNDLRQRFVDLYLYLGDTDKATQQMKILIENNPDKTEYLLQLAHLYKDLREPELANEIFELIFQQGCEDRDVIEELISYYKFEKKYQKLLNLYKTLVSRNLADQDIQSDYAETLILTKNYEQAVKLVSNLLDTHPQNVKYRIRLAQLYELNGDQKKALELTKEGIEKYEIENEEYLLYASRLFAEHNDLQECIACYEKLVSLNESNLEYKTWLAEKYVETRNFENATTLFHSMLQQEPENIDLKFQYASLYWLMNDFDRMHEIIDGINSTYYDTLGIHKNIAKFYLERGFFTDAVEHLLVELKSSSSDSAALRMLGLAYAWNNQPSEAKRTLRQYHKLYENDYYTHYHMGKLLLAEGSKESGLKELRTSLALLEPVTESKESSLVRAKIYALQNKREAAVNEFDKLISQNPDDLSIYSEYAESLLDLKDYEQSDHWLHQVLQQDPNNYRALRIQGRSCFEQGKYKEAVKILKQIESLYRDDIGLKLDLADSELAAGDWYNSTKTLQKILQAYPENLPAQKRLTILRRQQNEAFATEYQFEEQSGTFFKQIYNFVFSKATSSVLNFKFLFGKEKYTSKDLSFGQESYLNLGIKLLSRFGSKFQSLFGARAQKNENDWNLSANGMIRWYLNPSNSLAISSSLNEIWNDPLSASFFQGRRHTAQSDLNLFLLNRIFLWNRFSYESHAINKNSHFGDAFRSNLQIGYEWRTNPQFLTYYEFYGLKYSYRNRADRDLISIPENESVHYFGLILSQQLTPRFYYHLGGSLGFNTDRSSAVFFGSVDLEYMLLNRIRLRSRFTYGSESRLAGNEEDKTLLLDLYYFY